MRSVVANVSFGIYALMPLGWIFMAAIVAIEAWILSRLLFAKSWHGKAASAAVVANLASGAVGFGLSTFLNGGWWLVVWMPWVSRHEVDSTRQLTALTVYYACAFVLSVAIEGICEQLMLKSHADWKKIWRACLLANVASYAAGSVVMYSWSFGLWR